MLKSPEWAVALRQRDSRLSLKAQVLTLMVMSASSKVSSDSERVQLLHTPALQGFGDLTQLKLPGKTVPTGIKSLGQPLGVGSLVEVKGPRHVLTSPDFCLFTRE